MDYKSVRDLFDTQLLCAFLHTVRCSNLTATEDKPNNRVKPPSNLNNLFVKTQSNSGQFEICIIKFRSVWNWCMAYILIRKVSKVSSLKSSHLHIIIFVKITTSERSDELCKKQLVKNTPNQIFVVCSFFSLWVNAWRPGADIGFGRGGGQLWGLPTSASKFFFFRIT